MVKMRMTPMSSPRASSPPWKGPAKKKSRYKPHPKKSHQASMFIKAVPLLAFLPNTSKE
jgi:hypothetical protein